MKSGITIIVNSCDAYEDLWFPFFKLYHFFWPNCPYQLILNTETKTFAYPGLNIKCMSLYDHTHKDVKIAYSKRLRDHLKRIDSEYVLLLLDDFFFRDYVDEMKIDKCKQWMDMDPTIAVFSFEEVRDELNVPSMEYPGFELRPPVGEYKLNLQAALWRKDSLIRYIKPHENPWEMESLGNYRTFQRKELFYSIMQSEPRPINYGFLYEGMNVFRGKWVLDTVESLFHEHDIKVDYSVRGIYSQDDERNNLSGILIGKGIIERIKMKIDLIRSVGLPWLLKSKIYRAKCSIISVTGKEPEGDYYQYLRIKYRESKGNRQ